MSGKQIAHAIFGIAGLSYALNGLALVAVPKWFFDVLGPFGPYNRHYEGDLGVFLLPLGVATVLVAIRNETNIALFSVVTAATARHAVNHIVDATASSDARWVSDVVPLTLFAIATLWGLSLSVKDGLQDKRAIPSEVNK